MIRFIERHWYDIGLFLIVSILFFLFLNFVNISHLRIILLISFISLLLHQLEEYRFPGGFPQMLNKVMFHSNTPDKFPLNTKTAFVINVYLGWSIYFLAIFFVDKALWIAIISLMISLGNSIAHIFLFNIKGKTFYNPGMITCLLLFVPIIIYFLFYIHHNNIVNISDYVIGVPLGILFNYFGIFKLIDLFKDKNTKHVFR